MKKRISKSECTRKTEWNRPFLKILTFWSKSKFYLVKAFFFFCRRFGLGQDERVKLGQHGQTDQTIMGGDVIHDVMARVGA